MSNFSCKFFLLICKQFESIKNTKGDFQMSGNLPIHLLAAQHPPMDHNKIVSANRVVDGNQMTETCKNAAGLDIKVSIFRDKNGDGKYTSDEVVSVKYLTNAGLREPSKHVEYRDTDGDGLCDEVVTDQFLGEHVEKETPDNVHGQSQRMDYKYGFKWDSNEIIYYED